MLIGMIAVAQLMPVDLTRGGLRLVFALPYVAALAVFYGPGVALTADVAGLAMGLAYSILVQRDKTQLSRVPANVCVATVGVLSGSLLMHSMQMATVRQLLWALGFIVGYGLANLTLVTWLESRSVKGSWFRAEAPNLISNGRWVILYGLLGLAVTSLIADGMGWLVPLSLVPVWALRTSLLYQAKLYENYYSTISALNLMLQRTHPNTHAHLERVAETAEEVARKLGLPHDRARLVREAAILHDIGKIAVDEEILDKPAKLTPEEMDHVRLHSVWGAEILAPVKEFSAIVPWIRHHHERPDGNGYPDRLSDVEIPLESKIIAVVDAYDAMIGSDGPNGRRSYREPMSVDAALEELQRCSGSQFDPEVVRVFRSVVEAEVA
jgi:putative nucleotidyltransferase with HDIG domain